MTTRNAYTRAAREARKAAKAAAHTTLATAGRMPPALAKHAAALAARRVYRQRMAWAFVTA